MCTGKKLHPLLVYPEALRLAIWGDSDAGNFQEWLPNGEGQGQLADSELNPASGQAWDPRGNCSSSPTTTGTRMIVRTVYHARLRPNARTPEPHGCCYSCGIASSAAIAAVDGRDNIARLAV